MYHYGGNNPVKYTDPTGEAIETIWDIGLTIYDIFSAISKSTKGDHSTWGDVALDAASILIPGVPAGLSKVDDVVKIGNKVENITDAINFSDTTADIVKYVDNAKDSTKVFSKPKQDLVEMAKNDKKAGGITSGDMQAYIDLNKELPDPFPSSKVRFDKNGHPNSKLPSSRNPHGHIGPIDHIPVIGD